MKSIYPSVSLLLALLIASSGCEAKSKSYAIAYSSKESGSAEIYLTDIEAKSKVKITNFDGGNGYSAWSPNGNRIAFYAKYDDKKTWSIHTINSDGTNRQRLTHAKNKWDYGPAWSPNGKKIAFAREYRDADKVSQTEIWMMNSDGSDQTQIKSLSGGAPDFTPDGRIVFNSEFKDKKSEISIADDDGNNIIQLTDNEAEEWHPEVSPDGKHIAFMSDRDGNHEIYVMNSDGSNPKRLTNNDVDDWYPSWSSDGSQLIFGSKTDGKHNVYIMNKDGSSVSKIISNGSQAAWFHSERLAPEATAAETKLSFRDMPALKEAFFDTAPAETKDGLIVDELGIDGGNQAMIVNFAQEIADKKHGSYDSLLIAHRGKLLFESYYSRGRINLPHFQASATKVYTSMALGRAIQMGYLTMADLDKPLVSFLKDLDPTKFVAGVEKITLHQAMTMRSGIRISKELREEFEKKPALLKGQGQVQAYLEHSLPITAESQSFLYQRTDPTLVMQVLDAVVPGTAKDFIKKELLGKIGITNYGWQTDISGLPTAPHSSSMTSRDMLKWGTLAINKGKWNGEQLVPQTFIAKATSRILTTGDDDVYGGGKDVSNQGYGYFWWSADLKHDNKSYFTKSAQGGGGQYIILIEELDLLIVFTDHDNDNTTLQLTAERILPAFIENTVATISDKSDSQDKFPVLESPYIGQKLPGFTPEVFASGIVSKEHRDWTGRFTPDIKEYYFGRYNNISKKSSKVLFKFENNRWLETELEPRMGGSISPDGKIMHSGNQYRQRTDNGWSELKSLGSQFEDIGIMVLTVSSQGTYVFDDYKTDKLRYSRLTHGNRQTPKAFGKEINSGKWTAHPFIAPDESYIIWDSEREGGYGDKDLYISFRQQDGSYGDAINFGDKINTEGPDTGGVVSPDGKYFFFNKKLSSEDSDTFWVDAQIIETLRPNMNLIK